MGEASRVLVTNQNLKDIEKMLSESVQRVIEGSRYSHLSTSRRNTVATFVARKTNSFLQLLATNCREATEEEIPVESVDSKLIRQVEELTTQLNSVEQQLIKERKVKAQEYETLMEENLKQRYRVHDSTEDSLEEVNNNQVISEQISTENIEKLYECLMEEWKKAKDFSSFEDKLSKVSIVLQNMSRTDMNSLRPVLESVSNILRRVDSQKSSQFARDSSEGAFASSVEGKLLKILHSSDISSTFNIDC
ncbi:hypothetical protein Gasu2_39300 [Galdieria sulphuraria]|uniref:Uncharacterized protein n=1 Tax=Galdieria sulphuraria TaxID=130081 RepID=M2XPW9_GALSU|nr:uncharacterized protein Gasu_06710 [Galdieria sulphuraria]EME32262.1 hypothetical protein Gasu_06710 [Galdieria sulphuraria]GJD09691.1 hypothetical protein Gasu2_39300 [Galdieria sulphuraria]|eukprot:XP_005708782.1 hypothetical protein Gasu_06710 [Galdieria sulphuraria]